MTIKYTMAALLIGVAFPAAAMAQSNNTSTQATGQQFIQQVKRDSINEIREALLAEQKAQDPAVKGYARLMINDHTMLASEVSAAEGPSSTTTANAQNNSQPPSALENATGAAFDRAFIDHEVQQHEQSVQTWQHEASSGGSSEASALAKTGLPVQQEHLALAQAIKAQLGSRK